MMRAMESGRRVKVNANKPRRWTDKNQRPGGRVAERGILTSMEHRRLRYIQSASIARDFQCILGRGDGADHVPFSVVQDAQISFDLRDSWVVDSKYSAFDL